MIKKFVAAAAVTGGLLLAGAGTASAADLGAEGDGNGINVQAPIYVPINVCGISIPVVAAENPFEGNVCVNG